MGGQNPERRKIQSEALNLIRKLRRPDSESEWKRVELWKNNIWKKKQRGVEGKAKEVRLRGRPWCLGWETNGKRQKEEMRLEGQETGHARWMIRTQRGSDSFEGWTWSEVRMSERREDRTDKYKEMRCWADNYIVAQSNLFRVLLGEGASERDKTTQRDRHFPNP